MVPVGMNYATPGNKCNTHIVQHKQNSGNSGLISSLRHFVCILFCPLCLGFNLLNVCCWSGKGNCCHPQASCSSDILEAGPVGWRLVTWLNTSKEEITEWWSDWKHCRYVKYVDCRSPSLQTEALSKAAKFWRYLGVLPPFSCSMSGIRNWCMGWHFPYLSSSVPHSSSSLTRVCCPTTAKSQLCTAWKSFIHGQSCLTTYWDTEQEKAILIIIPPPLPETIRTWDF